MKLLDFFKRKTFSTISGFPTSGRNRPVIDVKTNHAQLVTQYKNWVYPSVNAIAEEVAAQKFIVTLKKQNSVEQMPEHPILELLERPNDFMSPYEMRLFTALQLNLTGNAFWLIEGAARPEALLPLNVMNVEIKPIENEPYKVKYRVRVSQNDFIEYDPESIIHFKKMDPADINRGKSPIEAIADILSSEQKAIDHHLYAMDNRAIPGGILTTENDPSPEDVDRMRNDWRRAFGGAENTQKMAFLTNNVKYQSVSQTLADLQMKDTRAYNQQATLGINRVSGAVMGIQESSNRATAEANDYTFSKRVIKPQMRLIADAIAHKLMDRYTEGRASGRVELGFEDPTMPDKAFNLQSLTQSVNRWRTINEARAVQGLPPIQDGDQILVNGALVPLDQVREMSELRAEEMAGESNDEDNADDAPETDDGAGGASGQAAE